MRNESEVSSPLVTLPHKAESAPVLTPAWASAHGQDEYGPWLEFTVNGVVQRLRWIEKGEFWMGSPLEEVGRLEDEIRHRVMLTEGFWLADTACTQALWEAVMGNNPSFSKDGPEHPVQAVSWEDLMGEFLPKLRNLLPGMAASLPTEAQWEYACRAGTETPFWFGETISDEQANFDARAESPCRVPGRYRGRPVPVKEFQPNPWGLYQMHGNVWEWCADGIRDYTDQAMTDPRGPEGHWRVLRGGSWFYSASNCRSADRLPYNPGTRDGDTGFRLCVV